MSELEKMQQYIQRTKMDKKQSMRYDICVQQMEELRNLGLIEMICLVFDYGKAKGFRMAMTEVGKGGAV